MREKEDSDFKSLFLETPEFSFSCFNPDILMHLSIQFLSISHHCCLYCI